MNILKEELLMAEAPPPPRKRERREEEDQEGEEGKGQQPHNDPLIAAILQGHVARFQQIWDQVVAESVTTVVPDAAERAHQRLLSAKKYAMDASNVAVLRIMALTTTRPKWPTQPFFHNETLEQAITANDLELTRFFYTVVIPAPVVGRWPLFYSELLPIPGRVDHFIEFAKTEEMCRLGLEVLGGGGFLLLTTTSFAWLLAAANHERVTTEHVRWLLHYSTPWWQAQRALAGGPGAHIVGPPDVTIATVETVSRAMSSIIGSHDVSRQSFELYRTCTSSTLWQAAEFNTGATEHLAYLLTHTRGAGRESLPLAPLISEWAQYLIVQLGADWTFTFATEEDRVRFVTDSDGRDEVLALLFDALTVSYLAKLFTDAWDHVMTHRFLDFATFLASRPYIPERAAVLGLDIAFPRHAAFGGLGPQIIAEIETAVKQLSKIYRRIALLLRDVADVAVALLSSPQRQQLLSLSRQLLARVAAAQPERLAATREVLQTVGNFPAALADWTSFLPYSSSAVGVRHARPSRRASGYHRRPTH